MSHSFLYTDNVQVVSYSVTYHGQVRVHRLSKGVMKIMSTWQKVTSVWYSSLYSLYMQYTIQIEIIKSYLLGARHLPPPTGILPTPLKFLIA